ncbi:MULTISPECIES: anaerobic ribonucleoside-triphosphate reductase activating protein [unclassified Clostridium]|uniref:anaerobic ribonucleoside-triphosphate reductase activating protein n=1 Tax=unclassified Clostridium TaxID=2614128 RepID=UPI0025C3592A|nr:MULTISPECIES: anaerobic ribonucleoside-triphosphate reductase activating protein [unclassified Clostridium]
MNYAKLINCDFVNGLGIRITLFISGCKKNPKCKDCYNQKAWSFDYGEEFTQVTFDTIIKWLTPKEIKGLSLLGGECMDNLQEDWLINLTKQAKSMGKDIWCWTGYLYEDLIKDARKVEFLKNLDVLVDGEFIPELKNMSLKFRNSSNQRVIDIQKSLKQDKVVLWVE